jgi:hypothetical protein
MNIMMAFELTVFNNDDNWIEGVIGDYKFMAKHFDEGSSYGIDNGRVSKLEIWKGDYDFRNVLVNYDRGWDVEPETDEIKKVFNSLMDRL